MTRTVLLVLSLSMIGCVAAAPVRLAAPLPSAGDAFVGGGVAAGGGIGISPADDIGNDVYGYALGGGAVAWRFAEIGPLSLEGDASAGVAVGGRAPGYVGAQVGLRGWWRAGELLALGVDTSMLAALGSVDPTQSRLGYSHSVFQPEVRALLAVPLGSGVWIGTRPGVLGQVQEHLLDTAISGAVDVPLSVTWQDRGWRFGVEAAVSTPPHLGDRLALRVGSQMGVVF